MTTESNKLKEPAKVSLMMLCLLLIGALFFYKERIFTDAAFIVFNIINTGKLQIQCERYGSFISQLFPIVAVHLHMPMKVILMAYSASFNFFYFGAALLLFYKFKDYALVILMALYYSLYVSEGYFWTNNELHQGVCWMFILYGFTKYFCNRSFGRGNLIDSISGSLVFSVLAFLAIFSHPGVIFPFMFLWGFFWIEYKEPPFNKRVLFFYLAIILAIFSVKYVLSTSTGYEGTLTSSIIKSSPIDWWNAFSGHSADIFWQNISRRSWLLPIMFIVSLAVLIRDKKYLLLSWVVLSSVGYFVILCITFNIEVVYYMESEFMPLTIFGTTAFVYYVLPKIKNQRSITFMFAGIFLVRIAYILFFSQEFVARGKRVEQMLAYMKTEQVKKLIVLKESEDFNKELLYTCWGLPYECMMRSTMNGDSITLTAINLDYATIDKLQMRDSLNDIRTVYGSFNKQELEPKYFRPDSTQPYVTRTYHEVFNPK